MFFVRETFSTALKKTLDCWSQIRRMEQSKRDGVISVYPHNFQQRVHKSPVCDSHQNTFLVFTLIKHGYIVKVKIDNVNLGMVFHRSSRSRST